MLISVIVLSPSVQDGHFKGASNVMFVVADNDSHSSKDATLRELSLYLHTFNLYRL